MGAGLHSAATHPTGPWPMGPMEDEMIFPLPYDGYMMLCVMICPSNSDKESLLILAVETGRDHPTFQPRWKHLCLRRCESFLESPWFPPWWKRCRWDHQMVQEIDGLLMFFFGTSMVYHNEKPICFLDHLVIS